MNSTAENKMGTMPIKKLVISISLPMMISMLVQALYNIVDSIFVARIHPDALTALSMAFPLQTVMIGFAVGTSVGVNAILSKALGEKNSERVNKSAVNGLFLAFVTYIVFLILGFKVVGPFYSTQTRISSIYSYGKDYLSICMIFSFGVFSQIMLERLLSSTGKTMLTMITQGTGAIVNLILDPILIFGYCGAPAMGVKGAATATVIGQCVAAVLALILNLKCNHEIHISFKRFRPDIKLITEIYIIAIPSIIMQCIGSIMVYIMNRILYKFSTDAVSVFGIYFKLQSFVFMPVFGLNSGVIPIIAYNYGARNKERLVKSWRFAWAVATCIMLIGALAFELVPNLLLMPFNCTEEMLTMGKTALRIIGVHLPVAAFCIITGTMFQALGKSIYGMITSIMRQLVVLLPAAYFLSLIGNVDYVWIAFPIAEIMSATVTFIFLRIINKKIISKL